MLLITPPFTQLNTPYPATAYLKGFLNTKEIASYQIDLGIDLILEIFSKNGLAPIFDQAEMIDQNTLSENANRILSLKDDYLKTIEPVIAFLQGAQANMARLICSEGFLPEAARFAQMEDLEWAYGHMGMQDQAKHLATLYLSDLSDFIQECIDEHFGFSRYAERLGRSANSFDELHENLQQEGTYIQALMLELLDTQIKKHSPKVICFSVPFPGNLFSALYCAKHIKKHHPEIAIAMGGGFPNTELRDLKDKRVFEYIDYITLDDGELPLENLLKYINNEVDERQLKRTFSLSNGNVHYYNACPTPDYKMQDLGTPDYTDLHLNKYISVIETANPMHSLWSDGHWNKLTMAHGCYWGKCSFCDVSLDYIKLYEPLTAKVLVDRMEAMIESTGYNGFHFVDEAAPPALMRELALEILRRDLVVVWWTNVRFEKSFTADLCQLLKASGCIAVSGGLEVASDRLLKLIDKGITVEQVAKVCHNLSSAGILVHSYLMYGYPTQTIQETIDSLEMVRQLFELNIVQSGFWHQFALTAHSPIGLNPEAYHIRAQPADIQFANNDVEFIDATGINHDQFSFGLKKSLYNYMQGICFDLPLQDWFDFKVPQTKVPPNYLADSIANDAQFKFQVNKKVYWLGRFPTVQYIEKRKSGKVFEQMLLNFDLKTDVVTIKVNKDQGEWLINILPKLSVSNSKAMTLIDLKSDYENLMEDFELFWFSKPVNKLKAQGLIIL